MSPEGVDGRFDSAGARKLGHLLAGRTEIGAVVAFAEGLQHLAEQTPGLADLIVQILEVESVTEPVAGAEDPVLPLVIRPEARNSTSRTGSV